MLSILQTWGDGMEKAVGRHARWISLAAMGLSLATSLVLIFLYRDYGGPGDEMAYYDQAARLIPFTNHFYGPAYFLMLRGVHDLLGSDWFLAGKFTSWFSAGVFLLLSHVFLNRLLPARDAALALVLVALNPIFIGQSYSSLTIMPGAACGLGAVVLTLDAPRRRPAWSLLCGLVFGVAGLVRYQNNGLLYGAVAGMLVLPETRLADRLKHAVGLVVGAALPTLLSNGLLLWWQGFIPKDYNYAAFAMATGEWTSFFDSMRIVRKYKGLWDILTSHWTVPVWIAALAVKQAVLFPLVLGWRLLSLAAGWLVPGLIAVVSRRGLRGPWLGSFLLGLFLTGIGSHNMLHYYVIFLPALAVTIAVAIQDFGAEGRATVRQLSWLVVIVGTLAWSPLMTVKEFRDRNWTEFTEARRRLEAAKGEETVVSTTAASLAYGMTLPFVDQSSIMRPEELDHLVERLREHHVTHLVVSERHTLKEYPELAYLLEDSVPGPPAGLQREFLIKRPQRLAVYRVLGDRSRDARPGGVPPRSGAPSSALGGGAPGR